MDDNQWQPDEDYFLKLTLIPGAESELVKLGKTDVMEITVLSNDGKELPMPIQVCTNIFGIANIKIAKSIASD